MLKLDGQVAVVTGAGGGLGRTHALALAAAGAKVVVNDLGGALDGSGGSASAAERVAEDIRAKGGEAIANTASVTDPSAVERMVEDALSKWGRIDALINNAGILRDKTFAKATLDDFRAVMDVHFLGAVICTKAVWNTMKDRGYGRIVFTTSSSGLFGNFGQSNYGAAKMALVGLMQTLKLEGKKYDIRVNCLAPTADTRMTEGVIPEQYRRALTPEAVSVGLLHLVGPDAPNGAILAAGAGSFERAYVTLTKGVHFSPDQLTAEAVRGSFGEISNRADDFVPEDASAQTTIELTKAAEAMGYATT